MSLRFSRHFAAAALLVGAALLLTGTTAPQPLTVLPCPEEAFERRIYNLVSIEVDGHTLEEPDATGGALPDHWCVHATRGRALELEVCRVAYWESPKRKHTMTRVSR